MAINEKVNGYLSQIMHMRIGTCVENDHQDESACVPGPRARMRYQETGLVHN